jgi:hypothetical protein
MRQTLQGATVTSVQRTRVSAAEEGITLPGLRCVAIRTDTNRITAEIPAVIAEIAAILRLIPHDCPLKQHQGFMEGEAPSWSRRALI